MAPLSLFAQQQPELWTAQQVRALSVDQAKRQTPLRLRGVVTYSHPRVNQTFVQDGSAGVFVSLAPDADFPSPGDYVEVVGSTAPGRFAPSVVGASVKRLGPGRMPVPAALSVEELFSGSNTGRWASLEGVVRGGRAEGDRLRLSLKLAEHSIGIHVLRYPSDWEQRWVDARVEVYGVVSSLANADRQAIGVTAYSPDEAFIHVRESPPERPFDAPLTRLGELGLFRVESDGGHRIHTTGVVTAVGPGDSVFLLDRGHTAKAVVPDAPGIALGDRLDVVGFYERIGSRATIDHARVRVIAAGPPPAPVPVVVSDLVPGSPRSRELGADLDMKPVSLEARLMRPPADARGRFLLAQSGDYVFPVELPPSVARKAYEIAAYSTIEITGLALVRAQLTEGRYPFHLLTRNADDIQVLRSPPWWTRDRVLWVVLLLLVCASVMAAWGASLRRRVAAQTRQMRERLESQAKLESRYRRLFERNLAALLRLSSDGVILDCNPAFARLLGYQSPQQLEGTSIAQVAAYPEYVGVLLKPRPGGGPQEVCLKKADGGVLWALAGVALADGETEGEMVSEITLLDITKQRESEKEIRAAKTAAEAANQAKSEFLANMSHEIRTPLNGILGMTRLALHGELENDVREYLTLAVYSAESLLTIVNDVLDFSKVEARKIDIEEVSFDVRAVFGKALRMLEPRAREKSLDLVLDIADDVPERIAADPTRLRQVVLNLLSNAVKFTEEGQVSLSIRLDSPDSLLFEVADTGIGVPADKRDLIFEPFRQADGCTTRRFGGTGLGLAVSARLVGLMRGRIWLESETGVGSRFFFTARFRPASEAPEPALDAGPGSNAPSQSAAEGPGLSILVAEDNPVNRLLAVRLLERAGHRVRVVDNGADAVTACAEEPFDLVLMDVQMPVMDGLQACREIRQREHGRRTPIIALTAHAMAGDERRCLDAGMDGYLTKPLDPDKLYAAIDGVSKAPGALA